MNSIATFNNTHIIKEKCAYLLLKLETSDCSWFSFYILPFHTIIEIAIDFLLLLFVAFVIIKSNEMKWRSHTIILFIYSKDHNKWMIVMQKHIYRHRVCNVNMYWIFVYCIHSCIRTRTSIGITTAFLFIFRFAFSLFHSTFIRFVCRRSDKKTLFMKACA